MVEFLGLLTDINTVIFDYQRGSVSKANVASALRGIKNRIVRADVDGDEAYELTMTIELFSHEIGLEGV